jgi:hypothetical protein
MANWWTCLTRSHLVGSARKAGTETAWWRGQCPVAGPGARRWWPTVFASVWSEACHPSRSQEPALQPGEPLAMLRVPGIPWRQFPAAVRKNIDFIRYFSCVGSVGVCSHWEHKSSTKQLQQSLYTPFSVQSSTVDLGPFCFCGTWEGFSPSFPLPLILQLISLSHTYLHHSWGVR